MIGRQCFVRWRRLAMSSVTASLPPCRREKKPYQNRWREMRVRNRRTMGTRCVVLLCLVSFLFYGARLGSAQDDSSIHVNVVLVQLNVAVTDGKGNYVSGLRPEDFAIVEDKIPQKTATFEEGNEPPRRLIDIASSGGKAAEPRQPVSAEDLTTNPALGISGANVFILFDTSNYM